MSEHEVTEEIVRRLRKEQDRRGDFEKVHPCPASSGDVPDSPEARLVILRPEHPHTPKMADNPARKEAAAILESRGTGPRNNKNAVAFLAADAARLRELEQAARQWLAWKSICDDHAVLNLDPFQERQAETKRKNADDTVEVRIPETYQWLLVPGQPDTKGAMEWSDIRLQGQDALAVRASKKMRGEELLLTQMGGVRLRHELDKVPLWRGDHVPLKLLAEDFAKYLYLPRLKDEDVLLGAVRDGVGRLLWQSEAFAYADRFDDQTKRYVGLQAAQVTTVRIDGQSVLVKPDVAAKQLEADRVEREKDRPVDNDSRDPDDQDSRNDREDDDRTRKRKLCRFHGTVGLDTLRLGRDAGRVAEEVVQHLAALTGATVKVTLEIEADIPQGASDDLVRTITENCRTLKFASQDFEEA